MLYIKIFVIVIIHNYKIIGHTCLLLCSYILVVNKNLEFIQEALVQECHRFLLQARQLEFWIAQRHRHSMKLISG
jgi:hypothetical protein